MESNKLTVEEFARKNLGKSFITFDKNNANVPFGVEAMIVGYNKRFNFIICSCTKNDGWTEMIDSDTILIQSPLNVSFFYITLRYEYYRMQLQLP